MTDGAKEVPEWLEPYGSSFVLAEPVREALALDMMRCYVVKADAVESLTEWLAWRERVAAALGLVEPTYFTISPIGSIPCQPENPEIFIRAPQVHAATVDKAVAAELRRLADEVDQGRDENSTDSAMRIRARADELDPP